MAPKSRRYGGGEAGGASDSVVSGGSDSPESASISSSVLPRYGHDTRWGHDSDSPLSGLASLSASDDENSPSTAKGTSNGAGRAVRAPGRAGTRRLLEQSCGGVPKPSENSQPMTSGMFLRLARANPDAFKAAAAAFALEDSSGRGDPAPAPTVSSGPGEVAAGAVAASEGQTQNESAGTPKQSSATCTRTSSPSSALAGMVTSLGVKDAVLANTEDDLVASQGTASSSLSKKEVSRDVDNARKKQPTMKKQYELYKLSCRLLGRPCEQLATFKMSIYMGPSGLESLCDHRRDALGWPEKYVHTGCPVHLNPYISVDSVTNYVQMVQRQQEQARVTNGKDCGALGTSAVLGPVSAASRPRSAREIKDISSRHSARKDRLHKKMEQSTQRMNQRYAEHNAAVKKSEEETTQKFEENETLLLQQYIAADAQQDHLTEEELWADRRDGIPATNLELSALAPAADRDAALEGDVESNADRAVSYSVDSAGAKNAGDGVYEG